MFCFEIDLPSISYVDQNETPVDNNTAPLTRFTNYGAI